jgi:hypothetical protein
MQNCLDTTSIARIGVTLADLLEHIVTEPFRERMAPAPAKDCAGLGPHVLCTLVAAASDGELSALVERDGELFQAE